MQAATSSQVKLVLHDLGLHAIDLFRLVHVFGYQMATTLISEISPAPEKTDYFSEFYKWLRQCIEQTSRPGFGNPESGELSVMVNNSVIQVTTKISTESQSEGAPTYVIEFESGPWKSNPRRYSTAKPKADHLTARDWIFPRPESTWRALLSFEDEDLRHFVGTGMPCGRDFGFHILSRQQSENCNMLRDARPKEAATNNRETPTVLHSVARNFRLQLPGLLGS